MAVQPLRVAIITDIHLGGRIPFRGELRKLGDLARPLLADFVRTMNEQVRPDLVVHLGDAIEDSGPAPDPEPDRAAYAAIMADFEQLTVPILHVTGNHDEVHLHEAELEQLRGARALRTPLSLRGWRLLTLATHASSQDCWTEPEAVAQLERELAASREPVLLFTHAALADQSLTSNPWFEWKPQLGLVRQRRQVREVLQAAGRVQAVFNGHLHWNHRDWHAGIPYYTIQSLTENIASSAQPLPAAAWALFTLEWSPERGQAVIRGEVFGHQPLRWEADAVV